MDISTQSVVVVLFTTIIVVACGLSIYFLVYVPLKQKGERKKAILYVKQNSIKYNRLLELNQQYWFNPIMNLTYTENFKNKNQFDKANANRFVIELFFEKGLLFETYEKVKENIDRYREYCERFDAIAREATPVYSGPVSMVDFQTVENQMIFSEKKYASLDFAFTLYFVYSTPRGRHRYTCRYEYNYFKICSLLEPYFKQQEQQRWLSTYYNSVWEKEEEYLKVHLAISSETELLRVGEMNGVQFEKWCKNLLSISGYNNINLTKTSGDYGADLICFKANQKIVVQCKCFQSSLGLKPVQEVIGAIGYYKAKTGMVITNSFFTQNARNLAFENNIELIDGDTIIKMIDCYKQQPFYNPEYATVENVHPEF